MSNTDFIEVPPPLYKYSGDDHIHDDNKKVLRAYEDDRKIILRKSQLRNLSKELKEINKRLDKHNASELLMAYERLEQAYNSSVLALKKEANQETIQRAKKLYDKLKKQRQLLAPVRLLVVRRNKIKQKLQSHKTAVTEENKEREIQRMMQREAEIIADQMSRTLARIGFKDVVTVGRTTRTNYVEFDHVVTTPDQHQFKIAASRRGFAGGTVELLPSGVKVTDILDTNVMKELSITLEREVWSPHVAEDVNNTNGAWIVVERLGLYEGIPKHVTYRQLMARYETADHSRIPIPAGLRKGRRINWTYLDSHASTHMMFTGITGSGKTNAVQASISAIVEKQSPADVLFVFVDLKNQGDFTELAEAPHLVKINDSGIISQIPDVVEALKAVRSEMHWRQQHIGKVAKNIATYNKRVEPADRLPRIVVLFDEYANTRRERFDEEAKIIDDICIEITQIGRASGIHLWIGIQQPRRDNMPPALRDNFTTSFIGHQANVGAAQSVTGNRSSLKLPDLPGRMLANLGWKSFEVQMPLISEEDILNAVKNAIEAYGDIEQYQLHTPENTDDLPSEPLTDHEVILQTAFDVFDGALKARKIWEHLKPRYSQSEVKSLVNEILELENVIWQQRNYKPEKQPGNYFVLVSADVESDDSEKLTNDDLETEKASN